MFGDIPINVETSRKATKHVAFMDQFVAFCFVGTFHVEIYKSQHVTYNELQVCSEYFLVNITDLQLHI